MGEQGSWSPVTSDETVVAEVDFDHVLLAHGLRFSATVASNLSIWTVDAT